MYVHQAVLLRLGGGDVASCESLPDIRHVVEPGFLIQANKKKHQCTTGITITHL